jgi:hypothetical protein
MGKALVKTKEADAIGPANITNTSLQVRSGDDGINEKMTHGQMLAAVVSRSAMSAQTLQAFAGNSTAIELADYVSEMRKSGDEVVGGDMGRVERMLVNQAISLDMIFNRLAQSAKSTEYMKNYEIHLRLALKAQAQARSTVEALALLKNPQPYIRQANIAQGPQQVNYGANAGAGKHQTAPNKVMEPLP